VLAEAGDRPPRYIGRVLELDLPGHLISQLHPWGIMGLMVQVEPDGMYVSVRDGDGRSMAAAWWEANAASSQRTPVNYTPASWTLLHPIFCSIWCDLKSEGVVLEKPDSLTDGHFGSSQGASKKHKKKSSASKKRQKIYLPPVRVISKARWGTDSDRQTIERAVVGGNRYRRLPEGWQERERLAWELCKRTGIKPAILLTREAAAERAEAHGRPAPPPGFTYVAPFGREETATDESGSRSIPSVRAKGLFSLWLGLQTSSIEPLQVNLQERE
jgi:hypothetical protein